MDYSSPYDLDFSMPSDNTIRWYTKFFNYLSIFCSQLPMVLDTSKVDVIVEAVDHSLLHLVNVFPAGRWRMTALIRSYARLLFVLSLPLTFFFYMAYAILKSSWAVAKLLLPQRLTDKLRRAEEIRIKVTMADVTGLKWVISRMVWEIWACSAAADAFELLYIQAWTEFYLYNKEKTVKMVSIFVDGEALRVPISAIRGTDRQTCEALLMWYSWLRVKKGFGEIILPKRLVRINKVKLEGSVLSQGKGIRTLEFGRKGASSVEFLRNPAKIPQYRTSLTEEITQNSDVEGLEFIRAWDSFAISIITLLPLILSLAFAGAWMGVSIGNHNVDPQVATQTAFTVASYIITAGALVIALFAFLDSSSQHGNDNFGDHALSDDRDSRKPAGLVEVRPARPQPVISPPARLSTGSVDSIGRMALVAEAVQGLQPSIIQLPSSRTGSNASSTGSVAVVSPNIVKTDGSQRYREV